MDWGSSGEIKAAHFCGPTISVPRPVGYRIVDKGGPDEHKYESGSEATAFGDGTNGKSDAGNIISVKSIWELIFCCCEPT